MIVVHAKVNHVLEKFILGGGWFAHKTVVEGVLSGPDGKPIPVTKVLVHLPTGEKLVVQESLEDIEVQGNVKD